MKKRFLLLTLLMLSLLIISISSVLGSSNSIKPKYKLPEKWYIESERLGTLRLANELDSDWIWLFYDELQGTITPTALEARAIELFEESHWSEPIETGTMTVADTTAGFAKSYFGYSESYSLCVVFVKGSTIIEVASMYGPTIWDWLEVSDFLNSITTTADTTGDFMAIINDLMWIIIPLAVIFAVAIVIIVIIKKRKKKGNLNVPSNEQKLPNTNERRYCMHCGSKMDTETKRCLECKKPPPAGVDTKTCKNCNTIIPIVAKFCAKCGAGQPE